MANVLQTKAQKLGDLELAILVCLIARQHCLFSTTLIDTQSLQEELNLVCASVFGLHPVVVDCSPDTTVEEFSEKILVGPLNSRLSTQSAQDNSIRSLTKKGAGIASTTTQDRHGVGDVQPLDERRIADIIIATNLDLANESVQIQALELIRAKRIFTRTAMHTAATNFMVLAIASQAGGRLSHHLNDLFCMSHLHDTEDGLPFLEGQFSEGEIPVFTAEDIAKLRLLADDVHHTPEIAAYLHNLVVFMRNHRFIRGGVTATATRQLREIAKALAPLHGLQFVSPSLVALAAHKVYPHRLKLATAKTEPSLQWGSDTGAIRRRLEGLTVEDAIENVLSSVETPL